MPKFHHYGSRPDHYRLMGDRPELPAPCAPGRSFLYLCIFSDRVKIGVSRSLYHRFYSHRKIGGAMEQAYLVELDRAEAFRREAIIKGAFGFRPRRAAVEWFSKDRLAEVVLLMRNPELSEVIWALRCHERDFSVAAIDPRFAAITSWAGAEGRRAA